MRKALVLVLVVAGVLLCTGVVVFRYSLGLSWIEAAYFVICTMTTVGYGDINLQQASAAVKLFGSFLMVAGAASMMAAVGIVADYVLKVNLQEILGRRRRRMQGHIIVCGLGNVGFRVIEQLVKLGEQVVAVERSDECKYLTAARKLNVPVVLGDARLSPTLEEAQIRDAKCLIAVTDDDLANLEAALNAKTARNDLRVVLRVFDQRLAGKLDVGLGIRTAFSTAALAAPAFALAAVEPAVVGGFYVDEDLMLNLQLTVRQGSPLAAMTTADLEREGAVSILVHQSAATGERRLHPSEPLALQPGDKLVVSTVPAFSKRLHELNAPA